MKKNMFSDEEKFMNNNIWCALLAITLACFLFNFHVILIRLQS